MGPNSRVCPRLAVLITFPLVDIPALIWYIRALKVKGAAFRQP